MLFSRTTLAGTIAILAIPAVVAAQPASQAGQTATDPVAVKQTDNNLRYATGGVGNSEQVGMESRFSDWRFKLINVRSGAKGAYISNVQVHLLDAQGKTLLETTTKGPWLYADLGPGSYKVEAEFENATRTRSFELSEKGRERTVMDWKVTDQPNRAPSGEANVERLDPSSAPEPSRRPASDASGKDPDGAVNTIPAEKRKQSDAGET